MILGLDLDSPTSLGLYPFDINIDPKPVFDPHPDLDPY